MDGYVLLSYGKGHLSALPKEIYKQDSGLLEVIQLLKARLKQDVKTGEIAKMPVLNFKSIKEKGYHKVAYTDYRGLFLTEVCLSYYCSCCGMSRTTVFKMPRGRYLCPRCIKFTSFLG